ncbi:MAG: hypothetical protein JSU94_18705 [Phycisphaerales bacterium]|nr:MAG: hypothetical protein JSU94_18705 [Phycisphaerales bacterium]
MAKRQKKKSTKATVAPASAQKTVAQKAKTAGTASTQTAAAKKPQDSSKHQTPETPLGTQKQRVHVAIGLALITAILFGFWFKTLVLVEAISQQENSITFRASDDLFLSAGPPSFRYDRQSGRMFHRGPMSAKTKEQLIALVKVEPNSSQRFKDAAAQYWAAVDRLAYQAGHVSEQLVAYILILGGLSGILGVQLRSVVSFVGNTCYKNELDIARYWPWYWMRPVIGFILGVVAVLVVQARLLFADQAAPAATSWWLAIGFLAGFGASEFTDKLRYLSRTLFGESQTRPAANGNKPGDGDADENQQE